MLIIMKKTTIFLIFVGIASLPICLIHFLENDPALLSYVDNNIAVYTAIGFSTLLILIFFFAIASRLTENYVISMMFITIFLPFYLFFKVDIFLDLDILRDRLYINANSGRGTLILSGENPDNNEKFIDRHKVFCRSPTQVLYAMTLLEINHLKELDLENIDLGEKEQKALLKLLEKSNIRHVTFDNCSYSDDFFIESAKILKGKNITFQRDIYGFSTADRVFKTLSMVKQFRGEKFIYGNGKTYTIKWSPDNEEVAELSFFKLKEKPTELSPYTKGSSWTGISGKKFRKAFDKIRRRYDSKTAFEKEKDPFDGKRF